MLKKFLKYVIPSICSMVIFNLYTLVDGIFVSHFVSDQALASINVSTPYITTIFSIGVLFAVGSSTIISIYRGQDEKNKADKVFTMNIITISLIALIISVFSFFNSEWIVTILKANADVFDYCNIYIKTLSCFSFFYIVSYCFEVLLKSDGFPQKSIMGVCLGAITNMVLDPVLMGIFHMGIKGAAIATGLSQLITFCFFLYHFVFSGKSHYHFVKGNYPWYEYRRLIPLGMSDCISEFSPGIMITIFNIRINEMLSTGGLVTFSIIMYIYNLVLMVMTGINQGMQPLISFSYGQNHEKNVRTYHKYARIMACICSVFLFGMVEIFARPITNAFLDINNVNFIDTVRALRLFSLVFLIMGQVVITMGYLVAIEKSFKALILSLLRGIVVVIFCLYAGSYIFGVNGIWLSCFISDCICLMVALYFLYKG